MSATVHDTSGSTPTAEIAVTGVTGRLGGRVARRLAGSGLRQTMLARSPERAPRLPGAETRYAEFGDHDSSVRALRGARRVLMVSASESAERVSQHRSFVDAAVEAGVRHLVYVSFQGAAPDATFTLARAHWETEQHIRASGLDFTFLRDNFYAELMPELVEADDVLRGPAGDGRVAVVSLEDVAEAATAVLTTPAEHLGSTYDLTGPRALTLYEVAEVLSEAAGRVITYRPESVAEAYRSRASHGVPEWQLDAWVSTYTAIANGELAETSRAVPRLTGHPATPLAAVVEGRI
ncbi:SDR family oxidoreductase [Actinopolyspora mortivallis]|uniref:SDR family oxidoreductase n=1 Tax=Actinopolyspora mortivallis TaxID=33906 RepID=UPI00035F3570|nr:SDR family oxidoreductase [Actinopolyspora mortivallis]